MNSNDSVLRAAQGFLDRMELKQRNGHGILEEAVNERGEKVLRVVRREPYKRK